MLECSHSHTVQRYVLQISTMAAVDGVHSAYVSMILELGKLEKNVTHTEWLSVELYCAETEREREGQGKQLT